MQSEFHVYRVRTVTDQMPVVAKSLEDALKIAREHMATQHFTQEHTEVMSVEKIASNVIFEAGK